MRILVVEDEQTMAESLREGLESEGFAVDVAENGSTGLWFARENSYDAIVLDLMLPEVNGYEVCRTLRAEENWTPILMLTAKQGEFDEAEALDTGADDFLSKPFSFIVLLARIRALVRRGGSERPATLEAGDLRLEPAQRRFYVDSQEVRLTPTEFCLMQLFMRRPGEVISKTEILDSCWDWAYEGDPNIVEVYVRHLRKKIDVPFDRKQFETVRGAGYRLVVDG